jgi:hypothetical protein
LIWRRLSALHALKATTGSLKLSSKELIGTTETLNNWILCPARMAYCKSAIIQLDRVRRGHYSDELVAFRKLTNGQFGDVLAKSLGIGKAQLKDYAEQENYVKSRYRRIEKVQSRNRRCVCVNACDNILSLRSS